MSVLRVVSRKLAVVKFAVFSLSVSTSCIQAQSINENSIKAGYILRFIDFVRWEKPLENTVRIGLIGNENLLNELSSIAAKRSTPERSFEIVQIGSGLENLEDLHLIYINRGNREYWPEVFQASRESSVLTIGSEVGFLDEGGLVEFVSIKNRLRFSVNIEGVAEYNLTLSSKLIQLSVR
ncbi:YfiR family protein [Puniceicoccaceae bacterium K14]|nr:YfiR family protein [Puniceicoccaceae bacterium K14]